MFRNNLKIAYRSIWKDRVYSAINIVGLALATAVFLLIIHYVRFEHSYENIHAKADNIYRVTLDLYNGGELVTTDCETYPQLGPTLLKDFPEVKNCARIEHVGNTEVKYDNKGFIIDRVYAADSQYFSIFNIDFTRGDKSRALTNPNETLLSETTAQKIFGTENPMGKVLKVGKHTLTVAGVFKDIPENTHLKFDLLIPFSIETKTDLNIKWSSNNNFTYAELVPGASAEAFNQKLYKLSRERVKDEIMVAGPIKAIHLHSKRAYEPEPPGNANTVKFLLIIAILILVIGAVNYVNLTTARSSERLKEAGIRKILGSTRAGLIRQFFLESLIINLMAFILALALVYALTPVYLQLIGKPLDTNLFNSLSFWIICALLFGLNCLLSGLQPAFMLSAVKPVVVMNRSSGKGGAKGGALRRTLVVGQFAVAVVVIAFTVVIYRQLQFMRQQDKGMNVEQILVINDLEDGKDDSIRVSIHNALRNDLIKVAGMEEVSVTGSLPGVNKSYMNTTNSVSLYGGEKNSYTFSTYAVDAGFVPLMKMKLLAGRNFRQDATVNDHEVLVNEETCRLLGFSSPEKAIGRQITYNIKSTIVGVLKNYDQASMKEAPLPMINYYAPGHSKYIAIKIQTDQPGKMVEAAEKAWLAHYPGRAFDYFFLDQLYNQQYRSDVQFGQIISVFSIFTIFITCLGLLGLTAHNIARRTKEIGIRKVLGASITEIVHLFAKDYVKLVLFAMVIGIPVAIWAQQQWLQDFALRASMPWWIFALAGGATLLIALLTVSLQSVKAALVNPVDSLGNE